MRSHFGKNVPVRWTANRKKFPIAEIPAGEQRKERTSMEKKVCVYTGRRLTATLLLLALLGGASGCSAGAKGQTDTQSWTKLESAQPADSREEQSPGTDGQHQEAAGQETGEAWALLLVNPWTPLAEDYQLTLTQLKNGQAVDERCYPDLQEMMDACRAEGLEPLICSSYRTWEKQEKLYQNKIRRLIDAGVDPELAPEEAGKVVAVPGTSEHQLGLALDIVDTSYQVLDEAQEETAVQQWLMAHSWEYGFILRYPSDKSDITGIIYEPWHYRYVGRAAAKEIYEQGICLEEYLAQLEQ